VPAPRERKTPAATTGPTATTKAAPKTVTNGAAAKAATNGAAPKAATVKVKAVPGLAAPGLTNAATKEPSEEGRADRAAPKVASASRVKGPGTRASGASAKGRAPLTVTLAYADREWTVAARLGSKVLAKPYGIRPAEALRMVSLLDVPGLHDAVESIIAAERVEAEGRARQLRDELAEIEARLAELTGLA
jgi:hypothetical protein